MQIVTVKILRYIVLFAVFLHFGKVRDATDYVHSQKAVTTYSSNKQLPPFGFAEQNGERDSHHMVRLQSSLFVSANTRRWSDAGLLLGQRRRRWPNIKAALDRRLAGAHWWRVRGIFELRVTQVMIPDKVILFFSLEGLEGISTNTRPSTPRTSRFAAVATQYTCKFNMNSVCTFRFFDLGKKR